MDVILVVGLRLGCLNHALLTAESIRRRGLRFIGWVANAIDPEFERPEANFETLRELLPAPCLGRFLHAPKAESEELAKILSPSLRELAPI